MRWFILYSVASLFWVLGMLVNASVYAQQLAPSDKASIEADRLDYDATNDLIKASGNIKIIYQSNIMHADQIEWQQKKDILKAFGNVILIDKQGITTYAEEIIIQDQMREAVMQKLRILMVDRSQLTGADAKRTGGALTVLNEARYTACKPCKDNPDKRPSWQIKASQTTHDAATQTIYHENLRLELMGVPIVYLPYISHPGPKVKKRSGFLTPYIGASSDIGTDISVPYFFNLASNYDLTVTPRITSKAGNMLKGNFRHLITTGTYSIDLNGLWVNKEDNKDNDRKVRGNLVAKGTFKLRENWDYGFQLERQTDETFLRRYNLSDQNYLTSFLYVQNLEDKSFLDMRAKEYDTTLASIDADTLSDLQPMINYHKIFDQKILGGDISISGNFLELIRKQGTDVTRAVISAQWQRNFYTQGGHLFNSFIALRADAYRAENHVKDQNTNELYDDNIRSRSIGYLGAKWSYPIVRFDDTVTQTIEPLAQLIISPNQKNDPNIPNEDSLSIDFDNTNLFEISRYAGLDLLESGKRADLGLRYSALFEENRSASIFIGQSLRRRKNELQGQSTGLEDRESDYVIEFMATLSKKMNLSSRLRVDKKSFEIVRAESDFSTKYGPAYLQAGYVFLDKRVSSDYKEREEVRALLGYKLSNSWNFDASIRQDMVRKTRLKSSFGLSFKDDCTYIRLGFNQDYIKDRNIGPSNSFNFLITLKTLGGVSNSTF